jgi:hypothetical protein
MEEEKQLISLEKRNHPGVVLNVRSVTTEGSYSLLHLKVSKLVVDDRDK